MALSVSCGGGLVPVPPEWLAFSLCVDGCFPSVGAFPRHQSVGSFPSSLSFGAGSPVVLGVWSSGRIFPVPVFCSVHEFALQVVLPSRSIVLWLGFCWFGACRGLSPFPWGGVGGLCVLFSPGAPWVLVAVGFSDSWCRGFPQCVSVAVGPCP